MEKKERNNLIDVFRGIAMLLVVLGHTISVGASDSENSILLNIIWTLQMPLFMIISGYVTKYSKAICSSNDLWTYFKRRTLSYLIPWVVWTFGIRGVVFGKIEYFNIKQLLWNMDNGYWFLTSIWTISICFGVAQYFTAKVYKKDNTWLHIIITTVFMVFEAMMLLFVGIKVGVSFFGIKFSVYYVSFFLIGFFFAQIQDMFIKKKWFIDICKAIIAVSTILYISLLIRFNFYLAGDGIKEIIVRIIASTTGCITVFGLLENGHVNDMQTKAFYRFLQWAGKNSLGIYVSHGLFINILKSMNTIYIETMSGFLYIMLNFALTTAIACGIILIAQKNKFLNKILFYK